MPRQFLVFLGIGLAVIGVLIVATLVGTRGAHLSLEGKILKVRTMPTDERNCIVVIDFRATNTASRIPFVVKDAEVTVTTADGKQVQGMTVARRDMDRIFQAYKLIGPKYNQSLIMRDKVGGGETIDRMIAAAVPLPESEVQKRKDLTVEFIELDGVRSQISESTSAK
jgi:hypothetical protein